MLEDVFGQIFCVLNEVVRYSDQNQMNLYNLAVCFSFSLTQNFNRIQSDFNFFDLFAVSKELFIEDKLDFLVIPSHVSSQYVSHSAPSLVVSQMLSPAQSVGQLLKIRETPRRGHKLKRNATSHIY